MANSPSFLCVSSLTRNLPYSMRSKLSLFGFCRTHNLNAYIQRRTNTHTHAPPMIQKVRHHDDFLLGCIIATPNSCLRHLHHHTTPNQTITPIPNTNPHALCVPSKRSTECSVFDKIDNPSMPKAPKSSTLAPKTHITPANNVQSLHSTSSQ